MARVSFMINCFGMEIDMKHRKFFLLVTFYTILSLLTGCGQLHDAAINSSDSGSQQDLETHPTDYGLQQNFDTTITDYGLQPDPDINYTDYGLQLDSDTAFTESDSRQDTEATSVYRQAALYIQEGFRKYNVKGSYHAYFAEPEASGEARYICEILLAGENGYWEERITYTVDEDGWYTFEGEYEPIMTEDAFAGMEHPDDHFAKLQENCAYETQIAMDTDLQTPIRYFSESGPTLLNDEQIGFFHDNWNQRTALHYYVTPYLYSYQDERLDIDIVIEYPQVSMEDEELESAINTKLREAFFYGYYSDETLIPEKQVYGFINRMYKITRNDADYLSFRISEYNNYRGANHPNEWETGITINMHTGEVLRLQDILPEHVTVVDLLDSGAFTCLWEWSDEAETEWIQTIRDDYEHFSYTTEDYNDSFYLTEDSLGLITRASRYYTCLEARLDQLEGLVSLP